MIDINALLAALERSGYSGKLEIDPNKSFADNKIDSLDVFAMLSELEENFSVTIEDEEFQHFNTPEELIKLLNSKLTK